MIRLRIDAPSCESPGFLTEWGAHAPSRALSGAPAEHLQPHENGESCGAAKDGRGFQIIKLSDFQMGARNRSQEPESRIQEAG